MRTLHICDSVDSFREGATGMLDMYARAHAAGEGSTGDGRGRVSVLSADRGEGAVVT